MVEDTLRQIHRRGRGNDLQVWGNIGRGKERSYMYSVGLIMLTISLRFSRKMALNDYRFSRKKDAIIAIIVILRKTKFY